MRVLGRGPESNPKGGACQFPDRMQSWFFLIVLVGRPDGVVYVRVRAQSLANVMHSTFRVTQSRVTRGGVPSTILNVVVEDATDIN